MAPGKSGRYQLFQQVIGSVTCGTRLALWACMRKRDRVHGPRESAARQHVTDPHPPEVRRKRGRPKGSTGISRRHPDSVLAAEIAKSPLATVYASHDGELFHALCKQPPEFPGPR